MAFALSLVVHPAALTIAFRLHYPGLDKTQFHSLANLLSLRNEGQAEPSFLSDVVLEHDWNVSESEDGHASSMGTHLAHQISSSEHGALKQKSLDCLAEFAANKKGGRAVACSAMEEAVDSVIVWIARNEGFEDVDHPVFYKLREFLGSLSDSDVFLWEEMVFQHQSRIEQNYIPKLRVSFKAYDAARTSDREITSTSTSASGANLFILRDLLFNRNTDNLSTLEKHERLIIASYNLRTTKRIEEILYSSASTTSKSKKLWINICLFARLRVAFECFKSIMLVLQSFKQTFSILGLKLDSTTAKAVLGRGWTLDKTKREFTKRQKQKPNIHAEVQMLMFLNARESSGSSRFPYFGCSKLSCFMCNHFLQFYGSITTRGSHGRLFRPWTVPNADGLQSGQASRTARALISMQKQVEKTLTSVVGGSSVLGKPQEQEPQGQVHIKRLAMNAERYRVADMFRR
ncbi:hypothetical protein T440DRAFT_491243 [Plenodomus tracheiphilus IPT5]|uniref:Uncharacterized protein n=1 Tax=Plenodomus tracheiphilus IPT5 TaxID=1408161 RepID=A0A6A7AYH8_9PLEO|nr:hypothetical protein T440DRAFT_491243 [Plenodomus tracheiphilus IPT5]